MNLIETIEFVRRQEKELVLFNVDGHRSLEADLREYFETQNVRIRAESTAGGKPTNLAVLSSRDNVLTIVDAETLDSLVSSVPTGDSGLGIADADYEAILRHLKETTFTSSSKLKLLYATREIEDRARRNGHGTIHAGFQRVSLMREQRDVYTDLSRRGLDVHTYGTPDATPPDLGAGQVHTTDAREIERTWFVVYDGGGEDAYKTALLAEERTENGFYGAWTYDPGIVDAVCEYLQQEYADSESEPKQSRG